MASAAAVSADIDRPPIDNDLDESGGIVSTVLPNNPAEEDDDEDEDIQRRGRRQDRVNQANGDDDDDAGEVDDDDLFGDDDDGALPEDPVAEAPRRELDDEELDSGDDDGRLDRMGDNAAEEEPEMQEQEKIVMDLDLPRQAGPEPSDGEMYILKVPDFMSFQPTAWRSSDFQPPAANHHCKTPKQTFSPFDTAMTTLRWRRSPANPSELQSNARILRWSDGSLTVQLASDPTTQYETSGNALAPPQRNPLKPTPTSINTVSQKGGREGNATAQGGSAVAEKYDEKKDSKTYLVAPYPAVGSLRVSHKITAGLKIKQSDSIVDDAIAQLQSSLAAASNASRVQGTNGDLKIVDEDPELARRRAEIAEREKARANKRSEAQKDRENQRLGRISGRGGSGRGGLNASMLEDDDEMGFASQGRVGKGGAKAKRPRQRRANSEYSSDEDYGRKGFQSKADEYDEEDDFVAGSDEEEIVEDDDDDDDGIREASPKRSRGGDDEEDAAGEDDDDAPVQAAAKKRRKVVLDDEEED